MGDRSWDGREEGETEGDPDGPGAAFAIFSYKGPTPVYDLHFQ